MNNDTEQENKLIAKEYKELLKISYQTLSEEDKKLIRLAFDTAVESHKDQRRKSGEAYIFHPIAVAKIIAAEIGMDSFSIASALLHDVVEDTDMTIEQIEKLFGRTVAKIVDGLTKIPKISIKEHISVQAENIRKMLLTLNEDIRVIIIKIADRLHNMQTMDAMHPNKQIKIASETLYIYAPIAQRIGLYNIKSEMEDLALKYIEPKAYYSIKEKIEDSKEEQNLYLKKFSDTVEKHLSKRGIEFKIKGRSKTIYSIWQKMKNKNRLFEEVYDKFAIRIIYKSPSDREGEKNIAWNIYTIVTQHFTPNPARIRDWITSPKSSGYEALHITVMGPQGKWVEVQMRSKRMDEIAERGYAAHFKYKQGKNSEVKHLDEWLNRLQDVFENADSDPVDFINEFRLDLYSDEIFVFTPNGDVKSLPKGSSCIDFAYSVHTDIGNTTTGVKVNEELVPLNHKLKTGDLVKVLTSEKATPKLSWLNFVKTAKAKSAIRVALKQKDKVRIEYGKEVLRRKLIRLKGTFKNIDVLDLVKYFDLNNATDLYYKVSEKIINNDMLRKYASEKNDKISAIFRKTRPRNIFKKKKNQETKVLVFGYEEQTLAYSTANCCNPILGDSIFGYITANEGLKIHASNCPNALEMRSNYAYKILPAKWVDAPKEGFRVQLKLVGIDREGLVSSISGAIAKWSHIKMKKINFEVNNGVFNGSINLEFKSNNELEGLIEVIKKIKGVNKVSRV